MGEPGLLRGQYDADAYHRRVPTPTLPTLPHVPMKATIVPSTTRRENAAGVAARLVGLSATVRRGPCPRVLAPHRRPGYGTRA
jgi:hypothetical protein